MKLETARKSIGKEVKFKKSYKESQWYNADVDPILSQAVKIRICNIDSSDDVEVCFYDADSCVIRFSGFQAQYSIEPKYLKLAK